MGESINLEGLGKTYGTGQSAAPAVRDVGLQIEPGEFFFLLGPSGCGKTTLLRMIAGLLEPTTGRILFGGRDVTDLPVERRQTAMVFQNYALWPHMTVRQNVEFGPKMQRLARRQRRLIGEENLARVQMTGYEKRKPSQLSGGQQQRVAVARALSARPQILLLDEPLSNLDARLRLHMRGQLRELVKSAGTTGVYVTHDQKEALSMADRIAVMNAGEVVQVGTPQELYDRPASRFVADFLGEANFIDGAVSDGAVDTAAGKIRTAEMPDGASSVTCCVRPERIGIAAGGSGGAAGGEGNSLPADVVSVTYLGELLQYVCRLGDGTDWRVSTLTTGGRPFEDGQDVSLHFSPQAVTVLTR